MEEDLTSKDLVFDWHPVLKEEHFLHDLRLLALAIDRKTKLVVFGLRRSARAIVKKAQLVFFNFDTQHVQFIRKHSYSGFVKNFSQGPLLHSP